MLSGDQTPFSVSREIIKNESNLQQAIGHLKEIQFFEVKNEA